MDLHLFYCDTEQADTWMVKQESFLINQNLADSFSSVKALTKKHEHLENSLASHEKKIKALDESANKPIEDHKSLLMEKNTVRKTMLEDSYKFQQF